MRAYIIPFALWLMLAQSAFATPLPPDTPQPAPVPPPVIPAPPANPIHWPVAPVPPSPPPPGPMPPAPSPDAPIAVALDELFVIGLDSPATILASPDGIVKVVQETGPIKIRGRFVGEKGIKTKTFASKEVVSIEAVASGRVEVMVIWGGLADASKIERRFLSIGEPTPPPVPPNPPPPPTPPAPPAPIPGTGLRCLVVFDDATLTSLPAGQRTVLFSQPFRDYLNTHAALDADGTTKAWRMWSKNVDLTNAEQPWKDAMARKRDSLPWIVVSDGKTGFEGPLPNSVDEAMALLKKFGG